MKYLKEQYMLLVLQIAAHIGLILMILQGTWQEWLIVFAMYFIIICVGMDMTYHRLLSHRSYTPPKWFEYFGTCCAVYGQLGTPLGWVALHRDHHRYSDTERDPHSPDYKSFLEIMFLILVRDFKARNIKDLLRDPFHMFMHKYYVRIHAAIFMVLFLINPWSTVYLYLAPAAISWDVGGLLNIFVHKWGYRNFETDDHSVNSLLFGYLTFGEGWHNNHHAHPMNSQFRVKWWEFDLAGQLIKLLDKSTYS
jgi:stearoyl-CoA desaturase (delta-9 desaturase)